MWLTKWWTSFLMCKLSTFDKQCIKCGLLIIKMYMKLMLFNTLDKRQTWNCKNKHIYNVSGCFYYENIDTNAKLKSALIWSWLNHKIECFETKTVSHFAPNNCILYTQKWIVLIRPILLSSPYYHIAKACSFRQCS